MEIVHGFCAFVATYSTEWTENLLDEKIILGNR